VGASRLILSGLLLLFAISAGASSHREAPGISAMPKLDATDFYMFRSYEPGRENYVTIIANYQPLQDAYGGPNYFTMDPNGIYRINIENDGDPEADIVFDFRFYNINNRIALPIGGSMVEVPLRFVGPITPGVEPNEAELFVLTVNDQLATDANIPGFPIFAKALDYAGTKTFPNYEAFARTRQYAIDIPGCEPNDSRSHLSGDGRVFVGQRREPFAVNLGEVFDLVNLNPVGDPAAKRSATADKNITSIILELPIECLTQGNGDVIGGWTSAHLTGPDGEISQVSRLGMPLVNEVVIGLADKDNFNASSPADDAQFATYVTNPTLPALLELLFGVQAPSNIPRNDLLTTFVTGLPGINDIGFGEMLRLNTSIASTPKAEQNNLGVLGGDLAGYPNGRRPGDDVVDISLRAVMGVLCHAGLGLCEPNDAPDGTLPYTDQTYQGADQFDEAFPFLTTPIPGSPNAVRTYAANLGGGNEVPSNPSEASGACTTAVTTDGAQALVTCVHTVNGAVAAHLHQAPSGTNGAVICNLGPAESPIQATCDLTPDLLAALRQGNVYVNVHSAAYPGGEVRGQLN
jgi:hypothetical protein